MSVGLFAVMRLSLPGRIARRNQRGVARLRSGDVMSARRERSIVLVKITSAEDLADSIAAACGGRIRAVVLLEAALTYLRGES